MALRYAVITAALLASGCTADQSVDVLANDTRAEGEIYPADYQVLKAPAEEQVHAYSARSVREGETMADGTSAEIFDLIDCDPGSGVTEIVEIEPHQREQERLALRVASLSADLARAGYAADVYRRPVAHYEHEMLAAIAAMELRGGNEFEDTAQNALADREQALLKQAASEIDAARAVRQPNLPPVRAEGGCGASEEPFLIHTAPTGGRVWLATKFAFDVCRARRLDPWDRQACRWKEVDPENEAYLSGTYVYQAEWPGGAKGRGTRTLDGKGVNDDEKPTIVTVRPG